MNEVFNLKRLRKIVNYSFWFFSTLNRYLFSQACTKFLNLKTENLKFYQVPAQKSQKKKKNVKLA